MVREHLKRVESEELAKRVAAKYKKEFKGDKKKTWLFFKKEGYKWHTINNWIKKCEESGRRKIKVQSGRVPKIMTEKKVAAVKRFYEPHPSTTNRAAAKKLKLKEKTLIDIKVRKLGIRARTKKSASKQTSSQRDSFKERAPLLRNKLLRKIVILDDETYVAQDPSQTSFRQFYHSSDPKLVATPEKIKGLSKFPRKFLVWQAMDQFGNVSKPFVSRGTMNANIYLEKCVKGILIPFIEEHHSLNQVVFWPDLVSVHYQKDVVTFLREKMSIVEKHENPPNVPHLRSIKKFWSYCKREYS